MSQAYCEDPEKGTANWRWLCAEELTRAGLGGRGGAEGEGAQRVKDLGSQCISKGEKNLKRSRGENAPSTAPCLCPTYPKPVWSALAGITPFSLSVSSLISS